MNDTLAAPPSAITGVHHLSLTVRDLDASTDWYRELFGLDVMMKEDHAGGTAVVLTDPAYTVFVGLHRHDDADRSTFDERRTGLDHVAFTVPDRAALESWVDRFADRGVRHSPIADRPYGSILAFRDPDDIQLELFAPPAG